MVPFRSTNSVLSHLTALRNGDVHGGLLLLRPHVFDLANDVHAVDDLAEDDVLIV